MSHPWGEKVDFAFYTQFEMLSDARENCGGHLTQSGSHTIYASLLFALAEISLMTQNSG